MTHNITEFELGLGPKWADWRNRYWSHLDTSDPDTCWIWQSTNTGARYPQFRVGSKNYSQTFYTHRIAYELEYGPIPEGQSVLHSCDRPWCCNPKHLRLGTQQDNMQDAIDRERIARGEGNGNRKLTEADVISIRQRADSGERQYALAAEFGVTKGAVQSVVSRRTWRHVA